MATTAAPAKGARAPGAAVRHATETLDIALKAAVAYERDDLVEGLRGARALLTGSSVTVHVVGEFKQGKSSLVNALLGAPICPVDDDLATSVPTGVRHAAAPRATATFASATGTTGSGWTETISPGEIAAYASESGNPGNSRRLLSVDVGIDRPILTGGLVLVDTPGVGGLGSHTHATAVAELPRSHAVLFVTDASQELTRAELQFLHTVRELCPTVLLVLTKTDLYPHWPRILEIDRAHLRRAGTSLETFAVSSELRSLATRTMDDGLNAESGAPPLVARLGEIVADAERVALGTAAARVVSAVAQMEAVAVARRDALTDPTRAAALVEELTRTKERADALRERTSRWQSVLSDGFADITSDVDFDLRARAKAVQREAEESIEAGDPAQNWPEFADWLRRRLAAEAMENYAMFVGRAKDVAATVQDHLEVAESRITARVVAAPVDLIAGMTPEGEFHDRKLAAIKMPILQKVFSGVVMFTMVSNLAGLGIPMSFGLLAGGVMGGLGVKEERKRALEKRRSEARTAIRRVVEDFQLQVGKDSRDAVRHVQRELRTAWSDRVSEIQRSSGAALAAAQAAVRTGESDTGARARMDKDLESLALVRARVDDLRSHLDRTRPALEGAPA